MPGRGSQQLQTYNDDGTVSFWCRKHYDEAAAIRTLAHTIPVHVDLKDTVFSRNAIQMLMEERIAMQLRRPESFVNITVT